MIIRIAVAVALVFAPTASQATTPATKALARAGIDQDALKTSAGRKALTVAVSAYCSEIAVEYPRSSPAEDQWLDAEIRGGGERAGLVSGSAEFGRRITAIFTDGCVLWSKQILMTPDRARNFVGLAYTFARFTGDAAFFARKNNVDPEKFGFPTVPSATTEALLYSALLLN